MDVQPWVAKCQANGTNLKDRGISYEEIIITANGVDLLTAKYVIYMEKHTLMLRLWDFYQFWHLARPRSVGGT